MKIIKIIDALYIDESGVQAKTQNGRYQTVHLQQGDLDGGCAVYSTIMILIMIRAVSYNDIRVSGNDYDRRYSIEKLKRELLETKGLHRDGNFFFHQDYDNIKEMLQRTYSKLVTVEHREENTIENIQEQIENNQPVLISFGFEGGGAHALVAVGIECHEKTNIPTKILCLDPGHPAPKFTYWNSIIDLTEYKGKYKYNNMTGSGECNYIQLQDILIIAKR